ncbi:MAG: integrase core domain-containing protein [Actinomycetota bacterium]
MDGKGRVTEAIMVERLWRTVKYEDIYIKDYESVEDLIAGLRKYFGYYNHSRSHYSLGGKTPAEVYWGTPSLKEGSVITIAYCTSVFCSTLNPRKNCLDNGVHFRQAIP